MFVLYYVLAFLLVGAIYGLFEFFKLLIQDPKKTINNFIHSREKVSILIGVIAGLIYYFF
jgi:hypothetical protein